MKVLLKTATDAAIRFDKGEEVFAGLIDVAEKEGIKAGHFTGIGTCSQIELGYFNEYLKEYRRKPFVESFEILSLIGNISVFEGKPAVHAHGVVGRTDFTVIGGHFFKIIALATCEIHITILEGELTRQNNPDFNLNLLA